ncbi:MAG: CDP-alcohol phosphatidyltransferase family protein [Anaerolineaceae bacterium]|nr:CDP-alcohol phosphatidyltransferase family protein [Anaerolineaceae bacterium]
MPEKQTLSDRLRVTFKKHLDNGAQFLLNLGLSPNEVTILGCIGNILAGVLIAAGHLTVGGIIAALMALLDVLDGSMARLSGKSSTFGAFLDSTLDRYSELMIFTGLVWHFARTTNPIGAVLTIITAGGSLLVSYTRARGQSLGYDPKIGLLSRMERYLILIPSLVLSLPMIGMAIMAVLTHVTTIQRMLFVHKQTKLEEEEALFQELYEAKFSEEGNPAPTTFDLENQFQYDPDAEEDPEVEPEE